MTSIISYNNKTTHVVHWTYALLVDDRKSIVVRGVANLFTNHRLCPSASCSAGVGFGGGGYSWWGGGTRCFLLTEASRSATTS